MGDSGWVLTPTGTAATTLDLNDPTWVPVGKGPLGQVGFLAPIQGRPVHGIPAQSFEASLGEGSVPAPHNRGPSMPRVVKSASLRLCGHVIHEKCYLDYRRSVQGSHNTAPSFDPACEFLCPLCKSVCNVIMPMLPGARNSAAASSDRSRATEETKTEREHAHEAKEAGTGSPDAVLLPRFDETVFVPFVESLELGEATLAQTLIVVGDRVKLHRGFGFQKLQ